MVGGVWTSGAALPVVHMSSHRMTRLKGCFLVIFLLLERLFSFPLVNLRKRKNKLLV